MSTSAHSAQVTEDLGADAGFHISAAHERKLNGFARRLRLFGNQQGTTTIGTTNYEICVGTCGYTVVSVDGVRNKCLEELDGAKS